ncbi:MAG: hypothetical protein KDK70_39570, partial [Myxococcales bacterium]|nr:hypothetical protein [Myxococcales bacterium]
LESYQVDGRFLTLDGRGRLTTNPALRAAIPALTPLIPDAALLDGSDTGTEIALAVNALRARIQELESRSAAQLATIEALQARLVDAGVMK